MTSPTDQRRIRIMREALEKIVAQTDIALRYPSDEVYNYVLWRLNDYARRVLDAVRPP